MKNESVFYSSPDRKLLIISGLVSLLLLGLFAQGVYLISVQSDTLAGGLILATSGLTVLLCLSILNFKSYKISDSELIISKYLMDEKYPLSGIKSYNQPKEPKKGLWRTMGNGGLFSYSGDFKNSELGHFKCYTKNWENLVALETDRGWLLIGPDNHESFLSSLKKRTSL